MIWYDFLEIMFIPSTLSLNLTFLPTKNDKLIRMQYLMDEFHSIAPLPLQGYKMEDT